MKKTFLLIALVFATLTIFAQAKKPTIMVVPSDLWCNQNGYTQTFDNQGTPKIVPNYEAALLNDADLLLAISKINEMMTERGFPLKNLESALKTLQNQSAEDAMLTSKDGASVAESPIDKLKKVAKADIIIDLDFTVMQKGPQRYISYNMRGLDSYTNKVIAANSGVGSPSTSAPVNLLLEEAVLNYMDSFRAQLMAHFEDMSRNGREVVVKLRVWDNADVDFESEFDIEDDYLELTDIISYWMEDNTVNHAPTRTNATATYLSFEQVRIPLYKERNGRMSALDARGFANGLRSYLKKEPFMIESKIYERGLGEVWIIIGEK